MGQRRKGFFKRLKLRVGHAEVPDSQFRRYLMGIFLISGGIFLWTPTRWMMDSFRHFRIFDNAVLPEFLESSPNLPPSAWEFPGKRLLAARSEKPAAASKKPRSVMFRLLAPAAGEVYLGGSFNNFDARRHPLSRREDGVWETDLDLSPGRYLYKFKVDGQWVLDPTNPDHTPEPRTSSILDIR